MKLKNKLYISFCIMVILPVLLSGLALGGLYCVQKESIERTYNVDDGAILVGVYSPIILFGKITDSIRRRLILRRSSLLIRNILMNYQESCHIRCPVLL